MPKKMDDRKVIEKFAIDFGIKAASSHDMSDYFYSLGILVIGRKGEGLIHLTAMDILERCIADHEYDPPKRFKNLIDEFIINGQKRNV